MAAASGKTKETVTQFEGYYYAGGSIVFGPFRNVMINPVFGHSEHFEKEIARNIRHVCMREIPDIRNTATWVNTNPPKIEKVQIVVHQCAPNFMWNEIDAKTHMIYPGGRLCETEEGDGWTVYIMDGAIHVIHTGMNQSKA